MNRVVIVSDERETRRVMDAAVDPLRTGARPRFNGSDSQNASATRRPLCHCDIQFDVPEWILFLQ